MLQLSGGGAESLPVERPAGGRGGPSGSPRGREGSAEVPAAPEVVEIGPWRGALPLPSLAAGTRVLVVEVDPRLATVFGERVAVPAGGRG